MGRIANKNQAEVKTKYISVRVTPDRHKSINKLSKIYGLNMSDFVNQCLESMNIDKLRSAKNMPDLDSDLKKLKE